MAVEVADTSAAFDLTRKAELCATAGVPEYWVVDLPRRLIVRQRESRDGKYRLIDAFMPGSDVPVARHTIPVDDIFRPSE